VLGLLALLARFVHVGRRMPAGGSRLGGREGDVACTNPTVLEFVGVPVCRQASWGAPVIICWQGVVRVLGVTSCSSCSAPGVVWPFSAFIELLSVVNEE
jgi:hypothetical protein